MTSLLPKSWNPEVFYPSSDGEPLAETSVHIDAARQTAERELEQERQRADQESQRANQAESEAERLREKLRSLGIEPDA